MPRGSRLYGARVGGSRMSQTIDIVGAAKNGSTAAVAGSGIRVMSDSWIGLQPAIEEPSNPKPSAKTSSLKIVTSKVTCCHLPRGSVKRRSTYFASWSLSDLSTSLAVFMSYPLFLELSVLGRKRGIGLHDLATSQGIKSRPFRFPRSGC